MEMLLQHSSLGVDPLLIYDWCCAMAQEMIICFGFVFWFISGTICKFRSRMWIACLLPHVTLYLSISWDAFNTGKCNRSNIIIACSTDYNDVCSYVASISSLTWSSTVAVGAMLEQLVPLPVYAPAEDKMIIVIKVNIWNEIRVPSTHNFRSTLVIISLSLCRFYRSDSSSFHCFVFTFCNAILRSTKGGFLAKVHSEEWKLF